MGKVKCSLCGYVFDPAGTTKCCNGCPLTNNCAKVHCPNCGYVEVAPRNKQHRRGWWQRGLANNQKQVAGQEAEIAGALPLTELPLGARARVVQLATSDRFRLQKFLALGVLPGVEVELVQRFPCFVLNLGLSQVALDEASAQDILVAVEPPPASLDKSGHIAYKST